MSKQQPAPDEQPKKRVAKRVVTPKRLYFMSEHGINIEATDAAEANELLRKQLKATKDEEVGE